MYMRFGARMEIEEWEIASEWKRAKVKIGIRVGRLYRDAGSNSSSTVTVEIKNTKKKNHALFNETV